MSCHLTPTELQSEIWKLVVGYEEYYSVSNLGRVRREKPASGTYPGKIIQAHTRKDGYVRLVLFNLDGRQSWYVHQLVAAAFIGPCPDGQEVNHKDTIKSNNRSCNLEYRTHKENMEHAKENGLTVTCGPRRKI